MTSSPCSSDDHDDDIKDDDDADDECVCADFVIGHCIMLAVIQLSSK